MSMCWGLFSASRGHLEHVHPHMPEGTRTKRNKRLCNIINLFMLTYTHPKDSTSQHCCFGDCFSMNFFEGTEWNYRSMFKSLLWRSVSCIHGFISSSFPFSWCLWFFGKNLVTNLLQILFANIVHVSQNIEFRLLIW